MRAVWPAARAARSAGGAQRGQDGLGDGELADEVDLQLPAEGVDGQVLQRGRHRDAGVVEDAVERSGGAHLGARLGNRRVVGDVHAQYGNLVAVGLL